MWGRTVSGRRIVVLVEERTPPTPSRATPTLSREDPKIRPGRAAALAAILLALVTAHGAGAAAPPNGLVGYWSFDEGSGSTAADGSGNGHTGNAAVQPDLGHEWVLSGRWLPLLRRHRRLRPGSGFGAAADHGQSHALGLDQAHRRAQRPVRRQQAVRVRARPRSGHGALSAELVAQGVERDTCLRQPGGGDGEQPVAARRSRPRRRQPARSAATRTAPSR